MLNLFWFLLPVVLCTVSEAQSLVEAVAKMDDDLAVPGNAPLAMEEFEAISNEVDESDFE